MKNLEKFIRINFNSDLTKLNNFWYKFLMNELLLIRTDFYYLYYNKNFVEIVIIFNILAIKYLLK